MSRVDPNQAEFSAADIASLFGVEIDPRWRARGVTTDSRGDVRGALFVALEGDRFDGHAFALGALEAGAAGVVVRAGHPAVAGWPGVVVPTTDTLVALGELARHHRRRHSGSVLALGGSMGKTTTKEMLVAILGRSRSVLATAANNNNRVGVPLTLLQIGAQHDSVVIEVGTNRPGEIAALAHVVEPTHALLTNIAEEHLAELVDLDGVAREETALFEDAYRRGATILVNLDDLRLAPWGDRSGAYTFGTGSEAHTRGVITLQADATANLEVQGRSIRLRTLGLGMARNALAAAAGALALGAPLDDVVGALEVWEPPLDQAGYARMRLETRGRMQVLVDCYNASPAGMHEALDVLDRLPRPAGGRRIAVLGDMLELGAAAPAHHRAVLERVLGDASIDRIHVVGPEFAAACDVLPETPGRARLERHPDADTCMAALRNDDGEADVILVKASHGIGLERVVLGLLGPAS